MNSLYRLKFLYDHRNSLLEKFLKNNETFLALGEVKELCEIEKYFEKRNIFYTSFEMINKNVEKFEKVSNQKNNHFQEEKKKYLDILSKIMIQDKIIFSELGFFKNKLSKNIKNLKDISFYLKT